MADPDIISQDVFSHLVELAALELSPDEAAYLLREMNAQLRAIAELAAIDVPAETAITSHGIPYAAAIRAPLREDRAEACAEADEILELAPQRDGRHIVVPDQPATDLA